MTTIHRKKLFNGKYTAEEYHSKHAFPPGARCKGCRSPHLMTRIIILGDLQVVKQKDPMMDVLAQINPEKFLSCLVQTKHGPYIRISTTYACKACTPAMERVAAKAPDWCIVDINRGPGPDKTVVGPTH